MCRLEENNVRLPERVRNQQMSIRNYVRMHTEINNKGYIDENKMPTNMRFLALNIKGIDPKSIVKIERFIISIQKYQIDMMLLNEVNVKWTPVNIDRMEHRLKVLGRETKMITADSTVWLVTKDSYLPGGLLTILRGKFRSLIDEESIKKGKLGNWIGVTIRHNGKAVLIINIYQIPNTSQ